MNKEELKTLSTCLEQMKECLEDAPIDFLGTGSNWKAADREQSEWSSKWNDNYLKAKEIIDSKI